MLKYPRLQLKMIITSVRSFSDCKVINALVHKRNPKITFCLLSEI